MARVVSRGDRRQSADCVPDKAVPAVLYCGYTVRRFSRRARVESSATASGLARYVTCGRAARIHGLACGV